MVLSVGASGFSTPFNPPGCQGDWLLTLPALLVISYGQLNTSGSYSVGVGIPAQLTGVPLYWQAGLAPTPCVLGCAVMIGFP